MLLVFPGQGSQKIGMGKDIYDAFFSAREVFHEVDDAVSFKLSKLIFDGTEDELKATENTQPALMTVSIAFLRTMKEEYGLDIVSKAKYLAGHSLGEYTALCASGVLSLSDTAKILRTRGKAMAEAYPSGGAMAAIVGLNVNDIKKIISNIENKENIIQMANDNSVGQVVISGNKNAIEKAMEAANNIGAKKTVMLEVSGPFHSKLMEKASYILSDYLDGIKFESPSVPIISNITAKSEEKDFKKLLIQQIVEPVRWRESILFAEKNGVSTCVEIGAGKILTGLVKRTSPNLKNININTLESITAFIA